MLGNDLDSWINRDRGIFDHAPTHGISMPCGMHFRSIFWGRLLLGIIDWVSHIASSSSAPHFRRHFPLFSIRFSLSAFIGSIVWPDNLFNESKSFQHVLRSLQFVDLNLNIVSPGLEFLNDYFHMATWNLRTRSRMKWLEEDTSWRCARRWPRTGSEPPAFGCENQVNIYIPLQTWP